MSDLGVQPAADLTPGLSQWQRVISTFSAPSKTFEDIKKGHRSWWLPFLITMLFFAIFFVAVTSRVTWKQVADNNQKNMPEFAKRMMERMPPEQRAEQERRAPVSAEVTALFTPVGILFIDLIAAGVLLATINFGFGGKAKFGSVFAVVLYAGLLMWPARYLLAVIAIYAGDPEVFNINNPAPTNVGAFFPQQDIPMSLYMFLSQLDIFSIWCMVVTAIGIAMVAGVKRTSGYIAVFGWWVIVLLLFTGLGAVMG